MNRSTTDTEGCLVDPLIQFLARQWLTHVVWALGELGPTRFGALRRALPGAVSARTLSTRLKDLESHGFVVRRVHDGAALKVEYSLTDAGRALHERLKDSEALAAGSSFDRSRLAEP
ncbi:MAG: helix-turn-helix transcriptional regulator [Beijerinckiaceae bacterium]|nr:helix-turn-helix transcriptional regulator [Beijerinckiaceae bacterium]